MPLDPLQKANFRTHEHTADQIIDSSTGSPINVGGGTASIEYVIDGGGAAVTTGSKGYLSIPFAATVTKVRLLADQTGSVVVDIKKSSYAGLPTTASITAADIPTISAGTKYEDTTLTGWTTAISAGDVLEYVVNSASTVQRVTVSLDVTRS